MQDRDMNNMTSSKNRHHPNNGIGNGILSSNVASQTSPSHLTRAWMQAQTGIDERYYVGAVNNDQTLRIDAVHSVPTLSSIVRKEGIHMQQDKASTASKDICPAVGGLDQLDGAVIANPTQSTLQPRPNTTPTYKASSKLCSAVVETDDDATISDSSVEDSPRLIAPKPHHQNNLELTNAPIADRVRIFDTCVNQFRLQPEGHMNRYVENRLDLVRIAIRSNDLFFLLFHQLFCLWSVNPAWLRAALFFDRAHEFAFEELEWLLGDGPCIPPLVLRFLARFPNPPHILQHNVNMRAWTELMKDFLATFPLQFNALVQQCQRFSFPPPARLTMHFLQCRGSQTFQHLCFFIIFDKLFPRPTLAFRHQVIRLFKSNQERFLSSLVATTVPLAGITFQYDIHSFRISFDQVRQIHGSQGIPVSSQLDIVSKRPVQPVLKGGDAGSGKENISQRR